MKKLSFILLALIAASMLSCYDDDYWNDEDENQQIEGKGEIRTQSINLSNFTGVDLRHVANVKISTGRPYYIDFTAYENILKYMNARVVNNILILEFDKNINVSSDENIRIDISMPEIKDVYLKGVGGIYIHGPKQESLNIIVDGVGDVDAFNLPLNEANIRVNGTGNAKVSVANYLDVIINGIGNVYYKGNPTVSSNINGIGELIKY